MDSLNMIPKLHTRVRWSRMDNGDYFLYNDEFDTQMAISESALLVIESINGEDSIREITDKLTKGNADENDYKNIANFICKDLRRSYILDDPDQLIINRKKKKFNIILLKADTINPICELLVFLFKKNIIISLYLGLLAMISYSLVSKHTPLNNASNWYIFVIGAFLLILFHEIGHCTALRFCGLKTKGIGVGIHFVFPMVFAEVTQAWVLSPKKRIIVDLGGFHFQLIITLLFYIAAMKSGNSSFMNLVSFSVFLFCFNLNPFIKSDIYWAISDYFNLPNLHDDASIKVQVFFKNPKLKNFNLLFIFGVLRYIFLVLVLILMFFYIYKTLYAIFSGNYLYSFSNIKNDLIMTISLSVFLSGIVSKYKER